MLTAIHFNNKPLFQANKVQKIQPKRMLPAKLVFRSVAVSEFTPQSQFRVGLRLAQSARATELPRSL
jgi:hypothetical protein